VAKREPPLAEASRKREPALPWGSRKREPPARSTDRFGAACRWL